MWCDKIQISGKCKKPVSKTHQDEQRQCGAQSGVIDTQIFLHPTTYPIPMGQKMSLVNFKHKITTSALVQDIHLTTKKYVCTVKDLKNNFKINQSN